jgi:hypothetical protein
MEDIEVPSTPEPQRDPYGLYQRGPQSYAPEPQAPTQAPDAGPENSYSAPQTAPYDQSPPPPAMAYAPAVPYAAPVAPPIAFAPPIYAYGGVVVGPRPGVVPYYGARVYPGGPVRAYGSYGYTPRAVAPSAGLRGYAYGYAGRGAVGGGYGYTSRGPMLASRGGVASRGGMAFGGGARVR